MSHNAYALTFVKQTSGATERLALAKRVLVSRQVRKTSTASIVLEQILYSIAGPRTHHVERGAVLLSSSLARILGLTASAVNRALYTLENADLIEWDVIQNRGTPMRHMRLTSKLVKLLKIGLRSIRKVEEANPKSPLSAFEKPVTKPVNNPCNEYRQQQKTIGRHALEAIANLLGRPKPLSGKVLF